MRRVEVVGHGGAGDFYPGNTRLSVEKALELGVDRIEIDVQMTSDGQLALVHDENIQFRGNMTRVRQITLNELYETLDDLLTLNEVIDMARDRCRLMIDMKAPGYEALVSQSILRAGIASETIVSSTHARSLRAIKRTTPGIATGLSTGHASTVARKNALVSITSKMLAAVVPIPVILVARLIDADHLMLNYRICTPVFVRTAHRAGLSVYGWTVNHPRAIRRLIGANADGLISNRPDLVKEALANVSAGAEGISLP